MKTNMNAGANSNLFANAKKLRDTSTFAEILLWSRLRNNQLGVHFRRQHPILNYVVDFYCFKLLLAIEVDGEIHLDQEVQQKDENKLNSLVAMGCCVLRFTNQQVIEHIEEVILQIKDKIVQLKSLKE